MRSLHGGLLACSAGRLRLGAGERRPASKCSIMRSRRRSILAPNRLRPPPKSISRRWTMPDAAVFELNNALKISKVTDGRDRL